MLNEDRLYNVKWLVVICLYISKCRVLKMGYLPEVVRIIAAHVDGGGGGKAIGTGFFLSMDGVHILEEGLIMTNAHVVTNSPVVKIMTTYIEHQALPVTVVSVCHDRDLALLKIEPQVQQFLKRQLHERYGLDHIPSLTFADSDTLRTGTELHAVGHPLGLIDQQFTTGKYQGCVHLNNEIRGLSGALINGGNSGGPLMCSTKHEDEQSIPGLHYFIPSRYKVIGVNTFKLTGENVDGENGFIHSNTVKRVLPTLTNALKVRYERESKVMEMLSKMSVKASQPAATKSLLDHLSADECSTMRTSGIEKAWTKFKLGGTVRGKPRTFAAWIGRHVFAPEKKHMHRGGPELLSRVLEFAETQNWDGLMDWRGSKRWSEVRQSVTDMSKPETRPAVIRILPPPPSHVHSPQIGITSQPIFSADLLAHYQCPETNGSWVATGGVLVTDIAPKSLYKLAGGLPGDIVFKFENESLEAELSAAGTWYSEKRDLPMSLTDLCNDTDIDHPITLHVLRKPGKILKVAFKNRQPAYNELPDVRQTYAFCDEGRYEQQQKAQFQGIVFAPLRLHHVGMFKLLKYMAPSSERFGLKVVVESVSPESPAYATDAIHAGSIITHINDEPAPDNWKDFQKCISTPHKETGCWVIDTDYNGNKSKYAVRQRTIQAK